MTVLWDFAGRGSRGCTASRGASSFAKSRVSFASLIDLIDLIDLIVSLIVDELRFLIILIFHLQIPFCSLLSFCTELSPELSPVSEDMLWTAVAAQSGASVDIGVGASEPGSFASELRFDEPSAKLVNITPMSLWFMVLITSYNYSYWGL